MVMSPVEVDLLFEHEEVYDDEGRVVCPLCGVII